jgi:cytochrome c-type biogenesis protein CcmH/NrfG
MPENPTTRRGIIFPVIIAFAAGFICGAAATIYKLTPAPADPHAGHTQQTRLDEMTAALAAEVERSPGNFQAWVQLGNLYYDSNDPEKAFAAYEKALGLEPNHADILTDLGVMYRRSGRPKQAVASFDRAISIDPSHETARFNKGVVLVHDLNDTAGAIAVWQALSEINPVFTAPNGQSLDEVIRHYAAHGGPE